MPRTRSPPFPVSAPGPAGRPRVRYPDATAPVPCHRTTPAPPRPACPPAAPTGVPAGQGPARWEVVLRLRASAVLPGWPLGKVNSNLACSGIPSPPGTPSPGPSAAWRGWIAAMSASWRILPCEGRQGLARTRRKRVRTSPSPTPRHPPVGANALRRRPSAFHGCRRQSRRHKLLRADNLGGCDLPSHSRRAGARSGGR
jgi:hypothetical protein